MVADIQTEQEIATQSPASTGRATFDPDRLAKLETGGLKAYYERRWVRCFWLIALLAHELFSLSILRAAQAAYYITRASIAWAPVDHDTKKVRLYIRKFYRLAVRRGRSFKFDPDKVARLEYIYWDLHRRLSGAPHSEKGPLIQSLIDLHSAIFGISPEAAAPSAEYRTLSLEHVDDITGRRSRDINGDWQLAEDYLKKAYRSLAEAR